MRRKSLLFGSVILVAALLIGELAVRALRFEGERAFVERELSKLLGLRVEIAGDFRLQLLPRPHLEASDVTVASPSGRASPHLLRLGELELELDLWRLLAGTVAVAGLDLIDAELRIEPDERGDLGLEPDLSALDAPARDDPIELELRQLDISNLQVFIQRGPEAPVRSLRLRDASFSRSEGAMTVELDGEMEGNHFTLDGRLGALAELLAPSEPYPIELRLNTEHATLRATGSIAVPLELTGIDVALDGQLYDLEGTHFARPLPAIGPVSISARLLDDEAGVLGLRDIEVATEPGAPLQAHVSGSLRDLAQLSGIELAVDLTSPRLDLFSGLVDLQLGPGGPLVLVARLSDADGALGLQLIELAVGRPGETRAELRGTVSDLFALGGVSLALRLETPDLARARAWTSAPLPDLGPLLATAMLVDADGSLGIESFELEGGRPGTLSFRASGEIDDLRELDELNFEASLQARDTTVLGDLLDVDLPRVGPVEASGSFRGSNEQLTSRGVLRLDATRLRGSWSASFPEARRPAIRARLESAHVHLDDLGIIPGAGAGRGDRSPLSLVAQARGERPGPDQELPFASLHALDLDLVIHAELLTGRRDFAVRDAELRAILKAGALYAQLSGSYEGGSLRVALDADAGGARPELGLHIDARGIDITSLLSQVEEETDFAGLLDAEVELQSRGRTRAELVAALGGRVRLAGRDGTLVSRYAQEFVRDFARVAFPAILSPRKPTVPCLVLDAAVVDGVATVDQLLLDAGNVVIYGEGRVYLAGDRYQLRLVPRVRDPGLVSVAAAVDVGGPLADPSFRPVPATIASSAVRALLTNAKRSARTVLGPILGRTPFFEPDAEPDDSCPGLPPR